MAYRIARNFGVPTDTVVERTPVAAGGTDDK